MSLKALYFHTLIVISLVLISFGSEANAQSIQIDIPDNVTAPPGTTNYLIPVNLVNNGNNRIVAFSFAVYFNQNVITPCANPTRTAGTLVAQDVNTGTPNFVVQPDTNTAGRLGIAAADGTTPQSSAGFTGSGILINLCFNVIGTANSPTSTTSLTFGTGTEAPRFQDFSGTVVPSTATGGSFFVTGTTAASVNLSGRVLTAEGRGLRGAQVRLTLADGSTRTVMTTSLGYYRFADLQAGQTVTVQVLSKKYGYQSQTVNLTGDITDVNLVAER